MGVPEGNGPLKQGVLDALENIRSGIDQFRFRDEGFFIGGPVAPLKADAPVFSIRLCRSEVRRLCIQNIGGGPISSFCYQYRHAPHDRNAEPAQRDLYYGFQR